MHYLASKLCIIREKSGKKEMRDFHSASLSQKCEPDEGEGANSLLFALHLCPAWHLFHADTYTYEESSKTANVA